MPKDPLQVDTGPKDDTDIANMDDSVPPTSIEDEDTSSDAVNEADVLAEVKLPFKVRKCSFDYLPSL